jgi:hypothetical protein
VSVLDAFLSTWSTARSTFGEGSPATGAQYDKSGSLLNMQTSVRSAAPGPRWSGTAAGAYATANTNHGEVLGRLAVLDQRLGAQVDQSSHVVDTGRKNLDALRQWVIDAAASVPPGKNRDQMLLPIVQKGLGDLSEIVTKSNGDARKIAGEIRKLDSEYSALVDQTAGKSREPRIEAVTNIKTAGPFDPPVATEVQRGPLTPGRPADAADPFVGNIDFGQWETVSTSSTGPYPPVKPEYRPFRDDTPLKVGPPTGMYVPGQTWIADEDAPVVQYKEGYRFRIAGTEATDITRVVTVNGETQVQRWVANVYEYQRNTSVVPGGDFGGLPPVQNIDSTWERISLPEIAPISANNAGTTYYLPDGCGGTVDFVGGAVTSNGAPHTPIMTRPR